MKSDFGKVTAPMSAHHYAEICSDLCKASNDVPGARYTAYDLLEEGLEFYPDHKGIQAIHSYNILSLVKKHAGNKQTAAAIKARHHLIKRFPDNVYLLHSLADIMAKNQHNELALHFYERAYISDSNMRHQETKKQRKERLKESGYKSRIHKIAEILIAEKRPKEAAQWLGLLDLSKKDKEYIPTKCMVAQCYIDSGTHNAAQKWIQKILSIDPENVLAIDMGAQLRMAKAQLEMDQGKYGKARKKLNRVLEARPGDIEAMGKMAECKHKLGNIDGRKGEKYWLAKIEAIVSQDDKERPIPLPPLPPPRRPSPWA